METSTFTFTSALSPQPSALSPQPSAFSLQPSAFSLQPSAFSLQPSTSNFRRQTSLLQPSPFRFQPFFLLSESWIDDAAKYGTKGVRQTQRDAVLVAALEASLSEQHL